MAGFALAFTGLTQMAALLKKMEGASFGEAWVGSAVVYGPMHEFGTKVLTARPHWRVAINEIVAGAAGDQQLQDGIIEGITAGPGVAPIRIALQIERRVKQLIRAKGIIDTGNYRGSIATGRSEEAAFAKSVQRIKIPSSIATR